MKIFFSKLSISLHQLVIFFLLFISKSLYSQEVVQIGAGEYFTSYRTDDGNLYATKWGHGNVAALYNVGLTKVVDVDGAQYTNVALTADGSVYIVGIPNSSGLNVSLVATDNLGNAFKGNSKVYGFYQ